MLGRTGRYMLVYGVLVAALAVLFTRIPTGFLPAEDQGVMCGEVKTTPGATRVRTEQALAAVRDYVLKEEKAGISCIFEAQGCSFSGGGQNAGIAFFRLRDWDERSGGHNHVQAIAGRIMARFAEYKDATIVAFPPPPIFELGNTTGFDVVLQDRTGVGHDRLMAARNQLLALAAQSRVLTAVRPNGLDDEPQYKIDIDWEKASAFGLPIDAINTTLSTAWGVLLRQPVHRWRPRQAGLCPG